MRLLCISDTTRSLAFSPSVRSVFPDVDLILSCGDIPLESYDYVSTMLRRDLYYVYGNHNLKHFSQDMKKEGYSHVVDDLSSKFYGFLLDGKCIRDKDTGLIIAGLGGSMCYNGGESQYSEREMKRRILRLIPRLLYNKHRYGRYLDILVTHAPPFGLGDREDQCHRGFKCFLAFMEKYRPKYLVHGHIHLDDASSPRILHYCETTIVNAYGCQMIDDDTLGGKCGR